MTSSARVDQNRMLTICERLIITHVRQKVVTCNYHPRRGVEKGSVVAVYVVCSSCNIGTPRHTNFSIFVHMHLHHI